ncbi:MAG: (d)CMP kinase [Actinomycetes bacterium]
MQPARDLPARTVLDTLVVAVDGPSGSGKSSTARGVASLLGLRYLDTGAMYRALTWWMLDNDVDVDDPEAVAALADVALLGVGTDPAHPTIAVDRHDVTAAIRTREVTNAVSQVSAVPAVRTRLVALQRDEIGRGGIVVEGRDIGTVVAPHAPVKVFLVASAEARAERRAAELPTDPAVTIDRTQAEMRRRDRLDSSRPTSPLARAEDAHEIDSTALDLDGVIGQVVALVRAYARAS